MTRSEDQALEFALELVQQILDQDRGEFPTVGSPEQVARQLDLEIGFEGRALSEVVANLERVLALTPMSGNRKFLKLLFGGRDPVATMAEIAAAAANTQMHTFQVAGAQILLEQQVIQRMSGHIGYVDGDGVFTPGGSLANLAAMVLARNQTLKSARDQGLNGDRCVVYTSAESHYSIRKNMGLLGLGRDNERQVPVDGEGRMDVGVLREMIGTDRASGAIPVMINATAGTTVLGAFDPLEEIADLAEEEKVWLHVDGSYGASILLCSEHRHLLRGIERTDSVTWSPHKMMGIPLLCATILVRRKGLLDAHFSESAEYLFQDDLGLDPGRRSIQCGRRNDALKLWAAWQFHGDAGYARRINRLFELTKRSVEIIEADPDLRLVKRPQSVNVCFEVVGRSSVEICDRLAAERDALVGYARVEGRDVIRLVCVNPDLRDDEIEDFFGAVKRVAAEVPKEKAGSA